MSHSPLLNIPSKIPTVQLHRDLNKHLKRGHRWIYSDSFGPQSDSLNNYFGLAFLQHKKEFLGIGVYESNSPLRFRLLCLSDEVYFNKNDLSKTLSIWSNIQWEKALRIREAIDTSKTTAYRLINGEGDGLPGLVIDLYSTTAVIKFDHIKFEDNIWSLDSLILYLCKSYPFIDSIYLKRRSDETEKGKILYGSVNEEIEFKENNLLFSANIKEGSKTGFFLDQRDNRALVKSFSKNKSVLNLFSYTGGFSIYTASGGAKEITSVDIAKPAIAALSKNYELNNLKLTTKNIAADAFDFLDDSIKNKLKFDFVINDPPSFAPNAKSVPQATQAYTKIFSDSIKLVTNHGYFAASSCSSHISTTQFIDIVREAFSKSRRRGTLVQMGSQPFDHPFPLAMTELQYLKFALFRLD